MSNYYEILGVSVTASQDEIKKAFKKLALIMHPDKNQNEDTTKKFQEINVAYETLGDPEKRKKYDLENRANQSTQSIFSTTASFNANNQTLTDELINILDNIPLVEMLEKIDQFVAHGADLYNIKIITKLLESNPPGLNVYFDSNNPGKIFHTVIRYSCDVEIKYLKAMLSLGYKFIVQDEDNITPFMALSDRNTLLSNPNKLVIKSIETIFESLIQSHLLPSYNDFEYFAKNSALDVLNLSLTYLVNQLKKHLTADQYAKLFHITIANCPLHLPKTTKALKILLTLSPQVIFYNDDLQNNCLHIIAARNYRFKSNKNGHYFVDFLEGHLQKNYPLEAYKILGEFISAKNNNTLTPEQITQDDKLKIKFQQLTTLAQRQNQQNNTSGTVNNSLLLSKFNIFTQNNDTQLDRLKLLTKYIEANELDLFKEQFSKYSAQNIADPQIGFALLSKATALNKKPFVIYLLEHGCDIFTNKDNVSFHALISLTTNQEIIDLIAQTREKNNKRLENKKRPASSQ